MAIPRIEHCKSCAGLGIPHGCQGPGGDENFIRCASCGKQGPSNKSMITAIKEWNADGKTESLPS